MSTWIRTNPLPVLFLASLVAGLLLVVAAAFTVGPGLGLLTAGLSSIAGGHWVTYLKTTAGGTR